MALKTLDEFRDEARAEIEDAKPQMVLESHGNGEQTERERTDAEYEDAIERYAQEKFDHQNNGYIDARKMEYPAVEDFIEAYTEKEILEDSTKWDAYVENYNKVRADHPKPE